jgi:hypothetical protein
LLSSGKDHYHIDIPPEGILTKHQEVEETSTYHWERDSSFDTALLIRLSSSWWPCFQVLINSLNPAGAEHAKMNYLTRILNGVVDNFTQSVILLMKCGLK